MADVPSLATPELVWDLGCELGEGPNWVGRDQALWFTDIKGKSIHRFDPETGARQSFDAPGFVGFALPVAGGGFVAGLQQGLHRFDPEQGAFELLTTVEPDLPDNRLNDAVVAPDGTLWFGSMDNLETGATGRLYRLGADGKPHAAGPGCCITNGPAFSPDGRTLYFVDTLDRRIDAHAVQDDGSLGGARLFARIEDGAGFPDGPAVDADGHVWIGLYSGWAARRYAPDGTLVGEVRFPVANITKIAFGGPDGRTAFATTARQGLSAGEMARQPLAGGLFSFPVDTPGLTPAEITVGV